MGRVFWKARICYATLMARRIHVTVKPRARKSEVAQTATGEYRVSVRAPARDGKANLELIEILAMHFNLPRSSLKIVRGHSARRKLIEIVD